MKCTIKILTFMFFVGNISVYSQSQSQSEKVTEFFKKANEAILKMPKVEITYSWHSKPLLTPKVFSSQVYLSVDRSLQNNDSVFGFSAEYGDWFQFFLNNEMCSGGSDSILLCRTTDTIKYKDNNELSVLPCVYRHLCEHTLNMKNTIIKSGNQIRITNYTLNQEMK